LDGVLELEFGDWTWPMKIKNIKNKKVMAFWKNATFPP
jgi:hypothetical protein